jgi:hypothetical protein
LFSSKFRINDHQYNHTYINNNECPQIAAPLYQQTFRWFREKYNYSCYPQWNINNTTDRNIFGNQKNHWYTNGISGSNRITPYHQYGYQLQDRLNPNSRYFRGMNASQTKYYKGYIYSVDSGGYIVAKAANLQNIWSQNTPIPEAITVGGPFYFYFGRLHP